MIVENRKLSEKTQKIYSDIVSNLTNPIKFGHKSSIANSAYGYTLGNEKKHIINISKNLDDEIFEITLIHELLHCLQREKGIPGLIPAVKGDFIALQIASIINSLVSDLDVEEELRKLGISSHVIDEERFKDAKQAYEEFELYNVPSDVKTIVSAINLTLIRNTDKNNNYYNELRNLFLEKSPEIIKMSEEINEVIENHGYKTPREMLRSMRRIAILTGMREKFKIVYNGVEQEV